MMKCLRDAAVGRHSQVLKAPWSGKAGTRLADLLFQLVHTCCVASKGSPALVNAVDDLFKAKTRPGSWPGSRFKDHRGCAPGTALGADCCLKCRPPLLRSQLLAQPLASMALLTRDEDGGLQHLKSHEQHPCSRAAAAATVHQLTVALLAAAFMTLFKIYRQLGYYQLYIWQATTSGWPPMIGANQLAAWNSMTNTERAAMLLFMNPPTRGLAGDDMETCLRVRPQGHCRGVARRLSPYPVLVLQQAGTYKAVGGQHNITVKSVRATLPSLLCHLFNGPNKVKMYKALQEEHRQNGSSSEQGPAVVAEDGNNDPDEEASVRAAAKRAFQAALVDRLGSTEEPTGMWMVCHRDKPKFAEYQPVAFKEYTTVGTQQPRQPRCLCYNCINLVHLFRSTVGQNTRTGATKVQQVSRKRRRGFPNY